VPTSVIIVDDFLEQAENFRAAALRLSYPEREGEYFPGRNSIQRLALEGLEQEISAIVREPLAPLTNLRSHAKCRIALAGDDQEARIHVDPSHWSGILYLSRPEDCRGGTEFFRHIETGMDRVPLGPEDLARAGFSSYDQLQREIMDRDVADRSRWECEMVVPMKFNRLVLLRPWLFHTSGPGFGDSIENGRLVYLMFFGRAPG
jgi:hypothetical protein